MKRSLILTFLLLLLTFGIASAANNIRCLGVGDTFVRSDITGETVTFNFENDVALYAASTGFVISATGNATVIWEALTPAFLSGITNPPTNIMGWTCRCNSTGNDSTVNSDSILMGGAAIPDFGIMPLTPGGDRPAFSMDIILTYTGDHSTQPIFVLTRLSKSVKPVTGCGMMVLQKPISTRPITPMVARPVSCMVIS